MKFRGQSGMRPSAEARRHVYRVLVAMIREDLDDDTTESRLLRGCDESDARRVRKEAAKVSRELLSKGTQRQKGKEDV